MKIIAKRIMIKQSDFYKNGDTDQIWWVDTDKVGEFLFSFDKKKVYNLFADYPYKLTNAELELFNSENPYWVEFFKDRLEEIGYVAKQSVSMKNEET